MVIDLQAYLEEKNLCVNGREAMLCASLRTVDDILANLPEKYHDDFADLMLHEVIRIYSRKNRSTDEIAGIILAAIEDISEKIGS